MAKNSRTLVLLDQASGYLQIDMLEAYAAKYDKLVIIAGSIVERGNPLSKDVKWHRIVQYNRANAFKRMSTWLLASLTMFWLVLVKYRKAHVVAITNPPFTPFIPWLTGNSFDILIYDMYPDALVHYGYAKPNGFIYKLWARLNRRAFNRARKVFTLTNGMKRLAMNYVASDKQVEVVPLWSDAADFTFVKKENNAILNETKSQGKFVLVYSGNLGLTHPVEKLVELGAYLDPDIFSILIIGGGAKQKLLVSLIKNKEYQHVHLLPWQPIERLSHNLYAGDINVVTLDSQASDLSIPSKTFNILSVGNPVLGICSKQSGLAELIEQNECGIISTGNDLKELSAEIIRLSEDSKELNRLKENSLKASKKYTRENANLFLA